MANLTTEKQKKIIKVDYIIRLFSLSLLVPTSLLGVFLLAYIIPYYFSVSNQNLKVIEQFQSAINIENKENVGESATRIVTQTIDQLKVIELYNKNNLIPSLYFNKIIENKNSNIVINRLSFNVIKQGQGQFLVSGISKNREGLVSFIDDLKNKALFTSVDSPVSDFAKDSDITFTLNINMTI